MNMIQEIEKLNNQVHQLDTNNWLHHDLFTYQWWIILLVNAIFFICFLYLIDRKRIFQMVLAYSISYLIVCICDDIGEYYGRWSYPHQLFPFTTKFDAVEFAVVPVSIVILYQMFPIWRSYLIAGILGSAVLAFIGLPIFVYLGITKLNNWNYFYSFLVLTFIFLVAKWIMDSISNVYLKLKQHEQDNPKLNFNRFTSKRKAR